MTREARLDRLARWGFPLVALMAMIAAQVAVPRVLQLSLSDAEYIAYVAVTAAAAYIGLADGGLRWSILREMSEAHGAGDRARFAAETARARRVFVVMTFASAAIAALGLGSAVHAAETAWSGATSDAFRGAVAATLLSSCLILGVGGYHNVLQCSTGRLLGAQVAALVNSVLPIGVLVAWLVATRSLTDALYAHAGVLALLAVVRSAQAGALARLENAGVEPSHVASPLGTVLGAGVALKIADVLPTAAFPHLLSVIAAAHVPTAVPARTFAGAPRMVMQQFLNLLQIHVTRRLAAPEEARVQGLAQYRAAAGFLTALQLMLLGGTAAVAVPVFELWLPARAAHVEAYLPGMLVEQALLAAALPSSILFTATGRLRTYGVARVVGVLLGLGAFTALLSSSAEAAFGWGLAISAIPHFALGAWAELVPFERFPAVSRTVVFRYAISLAAAVVCVFFRAHPMFVSASIVVAGALLFPRSALALWRMFHGVTPTAA